MKFARSWFLAVLVGLPLCARADELRFAPEADYGPFVFSDDKGQVAGLSVDLLQALAPLGGLQIRTLPARSLHEILAAAQRGEVDLISSLRPTAERSRFLAFSEPYVSVPAVLAYPPGRAQKADLDSLAGRAVAVGRGYAVEAFLRERHPAVRWVGFDDDRRALEAMTRGEVEALVADIASLHFVSQQRNPPLPYEVHQHVGFEYLLSFAFPLARTDIGERLNRALHALPQQQRREIVQRWVPEGRYAYQDPRQTELRALAGLSIGAGAIGLLLVLRRRRRDAQA